MVSISSKGIGGECSSETTRRDEKSNTGHTSALVVNAVGGLIPVDVPEPSKGVIHKWEREEHLGGKHQERHRRLPYRVKERDTTEQKHKHHFIIYLHRLLFISTSYDFLAGTT